MNVDWMTYVISLLSWKLNQLNTAGEHTAAADDANNAPAANAYFVRGAVRLN